MLRMPSRSKTLRERDQLREREARDLELTEAEKSTADTRALLEDLTKGTVAYDKWRP